jgi:hypothetical protein
MVSKCANPNCAATFRYFHVGKLFRTESSSRLERRRSMGEDEEVSRRRLRRVEFHWLCESCASKMTLVFDQHAGVSVRQNSRAASAVA